MNRSVPGLLLVRTSSTRLPRKCFLPFGVGSVLEHMAKRALHFGFDPIICTTNQDSDDGIVELARRLGLKVFRGSTGDKIRRLRDACNHYKVERFTTIDADDPFFDPETDHRSFRLLEEGYDFVLPPSDYYCGSVGFSVRKDVLDKAINEYDTSNSEMMWKIIERLKGIRLNTVEPGLRGMSRIRLTLDYEEDYHLLLTVLRILGPFAESKDVKALFARNPDLYKVNWFRNKEWKRGQEQSGGEPSIEK